MRFRTDKDRFILDLCRGKRVLDTGCVNHTLESAHQMNWRHAQISKVATDLVGLDYARDAVEALRLEEWNIFAGDAQDFDLMSQYPDGFDVVVASELIEHLVSPGAFIQCVRRHLAPEGILVLTTPHACGFAFFLETCVFGEERINDDHTLSFTGKQMRWFLEKCGMRIKDFHWLVQDSSGMPVHTTGLSRLAAKIFYWTQCCAATCRPYFAKEMIVVAEQIDGTRSF